MDKSGFEDVLHGGALPCEIIKQFLVSGEGEGLWMRVLPSFCLLWGRCFFPATDKLMVPVCYCGGKEIDISSFFQFETFAKVFHSFRKVAHGQVGLWKVVQEASQLFFPEACMAFHSEGPAGKVLFQLVRCVKMGVGMEFFYPVANGNALKSPAFHDGWIGLIKELSGSGRIGA